MTETNSADAIFKEFKEHSIAEFFKKNKQMLGYSGLVHSLVTVVHEYVTNSLDACEEAGMLPDISVEVRPVEEDRYFVRVLDNGPGIPKKFVGKALATILAGTKFHRYMQQRGQQGIGAAGCTMFSQITTGKPVTVRSSTGNDDGYSCKVYIDTMTNKPVVTDVSNAEVPRGLEVQGEFGAVKYENSDHGVYEYLKRTALANPHAQIEFVDPNGKANLLMRATDTIPKRPVPVKPHPLGVSVNDILELAQISESRKVSAFLMDSLSRVSQGKIDEIRKIAGPDVLEMAPRSLKWDDAKALVKAFKEIKWIAPDSSSISAIGEQQVKTALKNILNPEYMYVVERKPGIFAGGVPFVVEAALAYGGNSGKKVAEDAYEGNILRFANRVPLLFDSGGCAITVAARSIQWKRYGIDLDTQPVSVFVNVSSVHIPYSGVGKESIAQEDEIIEEIKLALMDAGRGIQRYIRGKERIGTEAGKYKTIMRYTKQLSKDVSALTGEDQGKIESELAALVSSHYKDILNDKGSETPEEGEAAGAQDDSGEGQ